MALFQNCTNGSTLIKMATRGENRKKLKTPPPELLDKFKIISHENSPYDPLPKWLKQFLSEQNGHQR